MPEFKFRIGEMVRFVGTGKDTDHYDAVSYQVIERHTQECYAGTQIQYSLRGRSTRRGAVDREYLRVVEIELERIKEEPSGTED